MTPLLALICLLSTPEAGSAPQGSTALGQVRSESGRSVTGATVRFVPESVHGMRWRAWLDPLPAPTEAETDDRGRFRFPAPPGPGCLLVEHENGLGCLALRASTGVPTPLEARALGSVTIQGGSPFAVWIRALRPGHASAWLGGRTGEELRLPAGNYLLLIEQGERRFERRVRIAPGQRQQLAPPGRTGPTLQLPPESRVELGRWPGIDARDPRGRLPDLAGPDVVRALVPQGPGREVVVEAWSEGLGPDALTSPQPTSWAPLRVAGPDGRPIAQGTVLTVRDDPGGPTVLARSSFKAGEAFVGIVGSAPSGAAGPVRVVVLADLARVTVLDPTDLPAAIALPRQERATIRVEGPDGDPVLGATVELRHPGSPLLDQVLTTDGRGQVQVPRPATASESPQVSVRSDDYLPHDSLLRFGRNGSAAVLRVERGLEIHGVAWLDPERRASAIEVELRDTTATLGLEPRVTVTGEDGSFSFRGLPDGLYALFAQTRIEGVTWSGKVRGVQPGPDEWRLALRNEDPAPPGGRRRSSR